MPMTNVISLATRQRIVPDVAERLKDEMLLAAMDEAEQLGLFVAVDEDEAVESAENYVSAYLKRPLRSEAEVRAGRLHPLFQAIVSWVAR